MGNQPMGVGELRAIFNHPQFAQIRDIIRQNPAAVQPILAQIAQSSPQLYNVPIFLLSSSPNTPNNSSESSLETKKEKRERKDRAKGFLLQDLS